MNLISWNYRGLGNRATVQVLRKLLHEKDASMVFLMETKLKTAQMNKVNYVALKYDGCFPVDCVGSGHNRRGVVFVMEGGDYG
ncbi:hypothetical protein ACS0TY_006205 [Phlomoides rotata]